MTNNWSTDDARGMHVLVVEDNLANQIVTTTFIQAIGCDSKVVENGQLALDAVQAENFDLILMDIQMPVMNGIDATRAIRAMGGPFSSVPIIAVTANVLPEQRAECMEAGMNDYVTKPVNHKQLIDAILRWGPQCADKGSREVETATIAQSPHPQQTPDSLPDDDQEEALEDILKGLDDLDDLDDPGD